MMTTEYTALRTVNMFTIGGKARNMTTEYTALRTVTIGGKARNMLT